MENKTQSKYCNPVFIRMEINGMLESIRFLKENTTPGLDIIDSIKLLEETLLDIIDKLTEISNKE